MATRIDGKQVSFIIREEIKKESDALKKGGLTCGLAVILVGDDQASKTYVNNKKKACIECGFYSEIYELPERTTQKQLLELVEELNGSPQIHGILVQMPLPAHLSEKEVIETISPKKDVDAFSPANVGRIMMGDYDFVPCTPAGIMELLSAYKIDVSGKNCVVIGRSNIVGKPMAMLLLHKHGTVTICHSKTKGLEKFTKKADILVSAIGKAKVITADMVKEGAVIIDVGMNYDENDKRCGDVDFDAVWDKVSYITPVPGGVGPMTITMLMKNTLKAAKMSLNKSKDA